MTEYLLGVDGGGTGTRVLLAARHGAVLAQASAGPSALGQGVAAAWQQIVVAAQAAFASAGLAVPHWSLCAVGAGLSGANNQPWADEFLATNPGFNRLVLESDAFTALLAAHGGKPGAMVAAGTGSIAEALYADGSRRQVGGWGFPTGDEGSGAWMGLRAMAYAQQAMDGRATAGPLAQRIHVQCGRDREALQRWSASAGQFEFAQLAPLVFECAQHDAVAHALLAQAAAAIADMARALDPQGALPLAIYGSVGRQLIPHLAPGLRNRCVESPQDAVHGALRLVHQLLETKP